MYWHGINAKSNEMAWNAKVNVKREKKRRIKMLQNDPSQLEHTFSVKSSAPLIIVASSCVSSPPLPAYDDINQSTTST